MTHDEFQKILAEYEAAFIENEEEGTVESAARYEKARDVFLKAMKPILTTLEKG